MKGRICGIRKGLRDRRKKAGRERDRRKRWREWKWGRKRKKGERMSEGEDIWNKKGINRKKKGGKGIKMGFGFFILWHTSLYGLLNAKAILVEKTIVALFNP